MEIIKNNQLLKIDLTYDEDNGWHFEDFISMNGITRLTDREWFKISNPEAMHFAPDDLKHDDSVIDYLKAVAYGADGFTMPALSDEEFSDLFQAVSDEDWESVDMEVARRGLLSMTHQSWWDSLNHNYEDLSDILEPYTYTARGYCQSDFAYLYLIGIDEAEARRIKADFELYAYDTPYRFSVELVDCQSGETIDQESIGGIYDEADLTYLKEELESAIKNLDGIDQEVMRLAFDAIRPLDYQDIKY